MVKLINQHIIKIQIGALLVTMGVMLTFTYKVSAYATTVDSHEKRLCTVEDKLDILATKDDLNTLKADLKDYINKQ